MWVQWAYAQKGISMSNADIVTVLALLAFFSTLVIGVAVLGRWLTEAISDGAVRRHNRHK